MNKDLWAGNYNIIKGKIKDKWGQLTDDDLTRISGKRDELLGLLQKKYGYTKDKAKSELNNWEKGLSKFFEKQ